MFFHYNLNFRLLVEIAKTLFINVGILEKLSVNIHG